MMGGNNRNFVIFVALTILILVVWQIFVAQPQIEDARRAAEAQATAQAEQTAPVQADIPTPGQVGVTTTTPGAGQVYATREAAIAAGARVPIDTPRVSGSVNLIGARIDDLRLTDYRETLDDDSPTIVLLSPEDAPRGYFAEFGWSRPNQAPLVDGTTIWTAPAGAVLTPESPLQLTYQSPDGLVVTRTIAIDANYMFTVTDSVTNNGPAPVQAAPYGRVTRFGEPLSQGWFILHEGMIGVIGEEGLQEVDYTALEEEDRRFAPATNGWLGITDKYWAAALIPVGQTFTGEFIRRDDAARGGLRYQADFIGEVHTIGPASSVTVATDLFAGAKEVAVVDGYDRDKDIERFELLIDWGWFYFITKPMFIVIDWLYGLVGNFGIAILLVTVLIKLIFFPLANRSYRSMAAMRKVTPQIQALRERHKDDRAKQQQAMLELYRKERINPIAGCWPILIQIPVFFALYKVLFVTIEMRQEPFFGWIQDLSVMDPIYIWPIIMGITMWVQFQLNPQAPGTPRWIFHVLPLVFTVMLASFPAGLVIYWAWNNFLSVLQQSVIMTRNGVKVDLFGNIRSAFKRAPKKAEDAKAKS